MASTPVKDSGFTGALHLLLLGLLLPAVLVSGQNSTTASTANMTMNATSQPTSTASGANSSTTQAPTSYSSVSTVNATTQSLIVTTGASTSQSPTTSPGATTMTTQSATTNINSISPSANSTSLGGGMYGTNGATVSFDCPSFSCNKSECYSMYSSQNATSCPAQSVCQLMRQMDMCYTVSCTASCADSCVNASQINCNENCCNFTGCLNSSFASMMNMTTGSGNATAMTPTSKPVTKTTTVPVDNGNKCHKGVCNGPDCYTTFKSDLQTCTSSQPHCQLMKETVDSSLKWTAGCFSNCSDKTTCGASTPPPCHLECCNATSTSCLWLNGTMNVPSFATRGPSIHTELMTCLLCLFAITLML